MSSFPILGASFSLTILFAAFCFHGAAAQEEVIPYLRGEVKVGADPLSEGVVILHQVSAESSGEIDSVRVGPDGTFQIRLPHVPDHASRPEIFFASVEYRGLLYFGPAVTEAFQLDSLYLIQAYDTLSVPLEGANLPISVRNLFLERGPSGWTVTDVFQLHNQGDQTLYSPDEGVVWSYPLPSSATDFQLGQADMGPDVVLFNQGRMEVYSPLPPGERLLMVQYQLPDLNFTLPLPGNTEQMEILVREPAPSAEFYPLSLVGPVELETGNAFRRYAGEGLVDTEITAEIAPEPWSVPAEWIGLLMAAILGVAGVVGFRIRAGSSLRRTKPPTVSGRDELLVAIAELDETFQKEGAPSSETRSRYEAERGRLLSKLKRLS